MTSPKLDNLVKARQLHPEPPDRAEFEGLVRSARSRLADAIRSANALESRFDLCYNAAHALSLAALRRQGYRSESRYIVFQCLVHTLDIGPDKVRLLALAHDRRNAAEYSGNLVMDEKLLAEIIGVVQMMLERLNALGPSLESKA